MDEVLCVPQDAESGCGDGGGEELDQHQERGAVHAHQVRQTDSNKTKTNKQKRVFSAQHHSHLATQL